MTHGGALDGAPVATARAVDPDAIFDAADRRRVERRAEPRLAELSLPEVRRIVLTQPSSDCSSGWCARCSSPGSWARSRRSPRLPCSSARSARRSSTATWRSFAPSATCRRIKTHQDEAAARVAAAVARLGLTAAADGPETVPETARQWVVAAAAYGASVPGAVRASLARGAVAASIFAFTTVYILTQAPAVAGYLRRMVAPRYAPLATALERNVRGVLAEAIYGTVLTHAIKSAVVLAFDVLLAGLLALISFVLGFFPIVGSWSVYVPVAAWLFVFREATVPALVVLGVGFFVNTQFVSMYLRPKLAAQRSRVLNFYWMFVGLVTGVYTLGLPGLVLGPALIAMLKAVVDAVTEPTAWPADEAASPSGQVA